MSELRKDTTCLNCGAEVKSRFCPECGQENLEPRESFGMLVYHFFSDFTHFDSKVFLTLKDLIFKPGFLTKEYLAGRRKRYLHPIRMYLFVSFVYFFVIAFFSSNHNQASLTIHTQQESVNKLHAAIDTVQADMDTTKAKHKIGAIVLKKTNKNLGNINTLIEDARKYDRLKDFENAQTRLPEKRRLEGVYHFTASKIIEWKQKYGKMAASMALHKFLGLIPKVMFFMLPLFALYLKWFYQRDHLYTDHIIFSLHFHTFSFLIMLLLTLVDGIFSLAFFQYITMPLLFLYLVLALRKRYADTVPRSFLKGICISITYGISVGIGLIVAALLTFITI